MDQRLKQLESWLSTSGVSYESIEPASADASFRRYFRITKVQYKASKLDSLIIMDAPPEKEDCAPFIRIAKAMIDAGLNVPGIILENTEDGFLLLSDLGTEMYLNSLDNKTVDDMYEAAINQVILMQKNVSLELPAYDRQRLNDEMQLFPQWYIPYYLETSLNHSQQVILEETFALLVDYALQQPQVFVHRDYHSRNLMINRSDPTRPGIIDFQDAVLGPVTYDLVSLLKDCYITWPRVRVEAWVRQYFDQSNDAGLVTETNFDTFLKWFDMMGLQRHIKVAGIFTRLKRRDGKTGYMKDIPRTMEYMHEVANQYPELSSFAGLLSELHQQ